MEHLIGLVVGFVLGYGVRSVSSRHRRERHADKGDTRIMNFKKRGPPWGRRQPLASCRQLRGDGGRVLTTAPCDSLNPTSFPTHQCCTRFSNKIICLAS
jgi:hypothetical protein